MSVVARIKSAFSDTFIMADRCIKHLTRSMDTLITVVAMPIMIMLLFVYVLGGAIALDSSLSYVNYVVPGILLMCIFSGIAYTALRLNTDISSGIFDRFHSMPIAKSSILGGHVVSSVIFNGISSLIIVLFAFLVGFMPHADVIQWFAIIGIILFVTLAFTWVAVFFGVIAKSADGAGAFSYPLIMLPFISSAFVPTDTMPKAVQWFADNQPMTQLVETLRSLFMGHAPGSEALVSLAWCAGIMLVAWGLSLYAYKRKMA